MLGRCILNLPLKKGGQPKVELRTRLLIFSYATFFLIPIILGDQFQSLGQLAIQVTLIHYGCYLGTIAPLEYIQTKRIIIYIYIFINIYHCGQSVGKHKEGLILLIDTLSNRGQSSQLRLFTAYSLAVNQTNLINSMDGQQFFLKLVGRYWFIHLLNITTLIITFNYKSCQNQPNVSQVGTHLCSRFRDEAFNGNRFSWCWEGRFTQALHKGVDNCCRDLSPLLYFIQNL